MHWEDLTYKQKWRKLLLMCTGRSGKSIQREVCYAKTKAFYEPDTSRAVDGLRCFDGECLQPV